MGWGRQLEDGVGVTRSSIGFAVPIRHAHGDDPENLQRGGRSPSACLECPSQEIQRLMLIVSTDGELITSRDNPHVQTAADM